MVEDACLGTYIMMNGMFVRFEKGPAVILGIVLFFPPLRATALRRNCLATSSSYV